MKEVEVLLGKRWILKRKNPEIYFKLRDQYANYQEFFKEKLGYRLIVNNLLIKAEKIPGETQAWMGIQAFEHKIEYVFLCLVLMFLEEKQPEEQFVLEQVTSYIQGNYPPESAIDWTIFSQRKALIRVLRFCADEGIILMNDGDDKDFEGQSVAAVLYENTGASKYFARHFAFDISTCKNHEDFFNNEWQGTDFDRGIIRRHRVYRKLAMNPVVYQSGAEDQDYLYLKNQRSVLAHDFEKYLPTQLHMHKNGAMLMFSESASLEDAFPSRKNISDVALHMNATVLKYFNENEVQRNIDDTWVLSQTMWDQLLEKCILAYGHGWSKAYREDLSFSKIREELLEFMEGFGLIKCERQTSEIRILPATAKLVGAYPDDYLKKRQADKMEAEEAYDDDGSLED